MSATNVKRGFIALTSAVIIAATLLVIVVAGSVTGFYERGVVLDAELKARSIAAAESCAQYAYLYLESGRYEGSIQKLNELDECRAGLVSARGTEVSFFVQATSSLSAVTNLRVVYDSAKRQVLEKEEIHRY